MKPLALSVEGFTCFAERQEVEFRPLGLFAIAGPTGAGKSSLLEAMVFALYGKVPRTDGYTELITLGRDRLAVRLDFSAGGNDWRVARSGRRRGSPSVVLERWADGAWHPHADGARDVSAEVERIIGLSFDAFQQAVLLPQGQFASFLHASPSERRNLLHHLLRTRVYERMRALASARALSAEAQRDALQDRLAGELADATAARLQELEAEQARDSSRLEQLTRAVTQLRARVDQLTAATAAAAQREALTRELAELGPVTAQLERLSIDARVAPLAGLLDDLDRARSVTTEARQRLLATTAEVATARESLASATTGLAELADAASERAQLDAALADARHAASLRAELATLEQRASGARAALKDAEEDLHRRERSCADARARRAALHADASGVMLPVELEERATHRVSVLRSRDRQRLERQRVAHAQDAARRALSSASELVDAAREAVAAAERREADHAVHALRAALAPGEPCPVCEHVVEKVPRKRKPKATGTATLADLRRDAERALAAEATTREQHRLHVIEHERVDAQLADDEAALVRERALLPPGTPVEDADVLEAWIAAGRAARLASERAAPLDRELELLVQVRDDANRRAQELRSALAHVETEAGNLRTRLAGISALDPANVEAQRQQLDRRRAEAERAHAVAGERLQQLEARQVAEEAALAAAERAEGRAQGAWLQGRGDVDESAVRTGRLSPEQRAQLARQTSQHAERHAQLTARLDALGPPGAPANATDVEAARRELAATSTDRDAALAAAGERSARMEDIRRRLESRRDVDARLRHAREDAALNRRLADDLRGERFGAYVVESTMDELVRGASSRLLELTGRYALIHDARGFHVEDHHHARERRSADTLSGGETFLASLALALELSHQVHRAAGAVPVESLFIDEGFGSLDAESLESVTAVLETLQSGGRMVGIVTHLPELTARLPARVRVDKQPGGSTVHVETT